MILILLTLVILLNRFEWRLVEVLPPLWESTSGLSGLSRGISPLTTDCAVPWWWVSLWEETRLVFSCRSPGSFTWSPRSLVYVSISFSTLEKTKHGHHPTLSSLLRSCPWIAHDNSGRELFFRSMPISGFPDPTSFSPNVLQGFWFPQVFFSWLFEVENDTFDGTLAISLIIGRDFAVTRSSPESCLSRFAIVSLQTVELKWLILNKHKWFNSSRVKFPFSQDVSKLVFGVDVLDLGFGSKLIRSNNQSSASLWVLETCLFLGFLPLKCHLDHCIVVLKQIQQSFLMGRLDVWGTQSILFSVSVIPWDLWFLLVTTGLRSLWSRNRVSKDRNSQIPQIESRNPV